MPIFDYSCLIWGRCRVSNINRLLKLHKRAARIILNGDIMTPSEQMFSKLKWLPSFPKRLSNQTCIMMYKTSNNMAPQFIQNLFKTTSETHTRSLRPVDDELLNIPFSRTIYYANAFAIKCAHEWTVTTTCKKNYNSSAF